MHALAKLSAAERQAILDDLVARTFDAVELDEPVSWLAQMMKTLPPELPDDPTEAQLGAWIELAELAADPSFAARVREMALAGSRKPWGSFDPNLHAAVIEHAGRAVHEEIDPASADANAILDRIIALESDTAERRALREELERYTDARVERYWQLLGVLNDRPPFEPMVPPYQWLIDALRAREP